MRRAKFTFGHSGHCQSPSLMPEGGAPGRPPRWGCCVWGFGAASSTKTVFRARFGVSLILAVQSLVALQSAILLCFVLGSAATRGRARRLLTVGALRLAGRSLPAGACAAEVGLWARVPVELYFQPSVCKPLEASEKPITRRRDPHRPRQRKMILTNCAACAAPLAHNAPRCVRCKVRYCDRKSPLRKMVSTATGCAT